ncbi:hypothetical protein [Sandaracinus amylolyticus]|uniref:hypothetical protein n=1 Tax=Sandaracinus amylolyticus TaxID=927083 RepID=UPI00069D386B|nr:hypothetical protein [Sandaracinus amylolyticus]
MVTLEERFVLHTTSADIEFDMTTASFAERFLDYHVTIRALDDARAAGVCFPTRVPCSTYQGSFRSFRRLFEEYLSGGKDTDGVPDEASEIFLAMELDFFFYFRGRLGCWPDGRRVRLVFMLIMPSSPPNERDYAGIEGSVAVDAVRGLFEFMSEWETVLRRTAS